MHLVTRGFLFASILRGIRMAPAAQRSCKRKSVSSYDPTNSISPSPRRRREVISDARAQCETVDCSITITLTADACFDIFATREMFSASLDVSNLRPHCWFVESRQSRCWNAYEEV